MSKNLEDRVSELEQQLAARDRELETLKGRSQQMEGLLGALRSALVAHEPDDEVGDGPRRPALTAALSAGDADSEDSPEADVEKAEELFQRLLSAGPPRLISYSGVYRRIFGEYSTWRNAVHVPRVIQVACRTKRRRVGQLSVQLDALIVGKVTHRPGPGHFENAEYTPSDWIQNFGTWPLLD